MILEPKSAPQHVWPLWAQFGPRSVNNVFLRPCHWLDRWDTQAIRLGSAFLAGAFVFWEKHDLEIVVRLGSAFLAGAFVFWEKHDLEISYPSRISVPSRGFCFLGKHDLENVLRLGSAFLAGAFVLWENTTWKKVVRLGSAFLAGAFVFWENTTWKFLRGRCRSNAPWESCCCWGG